VVALPRDVVPRGRDISKLLDLAHHVLHRRSERILLMTPGTFRTLFGLAFAAKLAKRQKGGVTPNLKPVYVKRCCSRLEIEQQDRG